MKVMKVLFLGQTTKKEHLDLFVILDFEPIVDVKECMLPYKAMVLFLANAIQESDYIQTQLTISRCSSYPYQSFTSFHIGYHDSMSSAFRCVTIFHLYKMLRRTQRTICCYF